MLLISLQTGFYEARLKILAALLAIVFCASLSALITEHSASANALSGVTLLSQSVSDFYLSPVTGITGISATWYKPFGISDTSVFGLHNAFPMDKVIIASGINYLDHPDYRWQDEYLSLSLNYSSLALGATQHLVYEKIGSDTWFAWDNDFGIKLMGDTSELELRYLRCRSADASLVFSASSGLTKYSTVSSSYTWRKDNQGSYAFASSYQIASPLLLQSSWQNDPARFGVGLKVYLGSVSLMYGIRTHPELALTHCLDLEAAW